MVPFENPMQGKISETHQDIPRKLATHKWFQFSHDSCYILIITLPVNLKELEAEYCVWLRERAG